MGQLKHGQPSFQGGPDRRRAGGDQPLHQDHQEADSSLLFLDGTVVAVAHVFGDGLIQSSLLRVRASPFDRHQLGKARLEQWIAVSVDRTSLLSANDKGSDGLARNRVVTRQSVGVEKRDQSPERVRLALMWCRRQQKQVGRRLRQCVTQLEPSDLLRAAADAVGLVDDDQVPSGRNQVLEPLTVVAGELLLAPTAAGIHRLHGVQRADDLIVHAPEVVILVDGAGLTQSRQAAGKDQAEILPEVPLHFRLPLQNQAGGRNDENPANKPPYLQLAQDQARFDRLAEPDFVSKEIADAIPGDRPLQG